MLAVAASHQVVTPRELAFYRCYSPRHASLPALAKIAGIRWTTEETSRPARD